MSHSTTFSPPPSIEQGRTWIDHFGELTVVNLTNNMVCDLVFEQCGWFGCAAARSLDLSQCPPAWKHSHRGGAPAQRVGTAGAASGGGERPETGAFASVSPPSRSANRYVVNGTLFGQDDAPLFSVQGKWQTSLRYWCARETTEMQLFCANSGSRFDARD